MERIDPHKYKPHYRQTDEQTRIKNCKRMPFYLIPFFFALAMKYVCMHNIDHSFYSNHY